MWSGWLRFQLVKLVKVREKGRKAIKNGRLVEVTN